MFIFNVVSSQNKHEKNQSKNQSPITNFTDPIGGGGGPIDPPPPPPSSEVGITDGQLSVSLAGAANYNIPIAVPPGINGVVPQISLSYSSQSGNGLAGNGWGVSGLSSITRIPSTKFHDNTIDPVDFDGLDRFALDGKRLILKSGLYGANGSTYETETFSNIKITLITGTLDYFKVEYPDGSIAYFGYSTDSNTNISYALTYWENPQGLRIIYNYNNTNNNLYINSIKYGSVGTALPINEIQFVYKNRRRIEKSFVGGLAIIDDKMISQIIVKGNGIGYRTYDLNHDLNSSSYERLLSITEKSGSGLKTLNPTVFTYENTNEAVFKYPNLTLIDDYPQFSGSRKYSIGADFNGDGEIDIIRYSKQNYGGIYENKYLVNQNLNYQPNSSNIGSIQTVQGRFNEIFTMNYLKDNLGNNYKLSQSSGWCVVSTDPTTLVTSFSVYSGSDNPSNPVNLEYTRQYTFPKSCIYNKSVQNNSISTVYKDYLTGDFNGDKITDVIAVETGATDLDMESCNGVNSTFQAGKTYFINLDKRVGGGFVNFSGNIDIMQKDVFAFTPYWDDDVQFKKIFAGDVNGDGKTDLIVIKRIDVDNEHSNVTIDVYSLNDSNLLVRISTTNFQNILSSYTFCSGDFNGDGKTDFFNTHLGSGAISAGSYIFESTGNSFVLSNSNFYIGNVIVADFDNDGKSDLIKMESNPTSGDLYVDFFKNTNESFSDYKRLVLETSFITTNLVTSFLSSEDSDKRPVISFIGSGGILRVDYQKNHGKEKLLKIITKGNGVSETINYSSLIDGNGIYINAGEIENYPNYDLGSASGFKVVSQVEKISTNVYKKQIYKYYGGTGNLEGLGFFGFRSVLKTNWFDDSSLAISNVTKFDISKRGAPIENFSVLGIGSPILTLTPTDSFINRSLNTYNNQNTSYVNPLLSNNVFKLQNTLTQNFNGLDGTSSEIATQYNIYNDPLQITTTIKNGTNIEQVSVDNFDYDPPINSPYIIDRPLRKANTITISPSGNTTSSEELYTYDINLLKQTKKKGDNTVYVIEDNEYDIYGNITKKTLSAPGLSSRIVNYEYDTTSHRFLTKKNDVEGLETLYTYNTSNGLLLTETLPSTSTSYLLKTTYSYDDWGKTIKKTNYLGKSENYVYTNSYDDGGFVKTVTGDDGSSSSVQLDDLGREIINGVKNIDGNWSYTYTGYDIYDRIIFKSQPYSSSSSVWNEAHYDVYGRLIQAISLKSTSSSGKVVNYSYSGLTTTENDGIKSKQIVKNAIGNIISLNETPGGAITYEYFANGNLKSTNCNNTVTPIIQDGWGRKIELNDPSAGIRRYKYNHFGELIEEEVVGQGKTVYDIDAVGKINLETITDVGGIIKSKKTYTYDATLKYLTNIIFDDYTGTPSTNIQYKYVYDRYKRLISTEEDASQRAKFTKTAYYDLYGRIANESYSGENKSDASQTYISVTNTFKNGYKWQIIDDNTSIVLWQTNTVNQQGKLLTGALGNGITITNTYDIFGFPTQIKHNKASTNIMTLTTVFDPIRGNLTSRTNNMFGTWNETLTYDNLDRLTNYQDVSGAQTQSYNVDGTISTNNIGSYAYNIQGMPFQVSTVTPANPSAALTYYTGRDQNIMYNVFKSPITITEQNKENIDFEYNAFNGRTAMYYGGLQTLKNQRPYFKFYSADGSMEIKRKTTTPSSVEFVTYIGGDAYTAPVIFKDNGITQDFFYLHRDYQGTIVGITNSTGVIVEKRLFDVWGSLIKFANNSGVTTVPTTSSGLFLDRGYTGHEHLLGVGLINMNGRIYDPKFHKFLQPDNNLQDPFNTQNYNRYAYGMNNPTKYADPSGESLFDIFGFLFSTYVHGAQATGEANPLNWNASGWANAALGTASSMASYGATNYANNYIDGYGNHPEMNTNYYISGQQANNGYVPSAVIQMPTQHTFLGINMTALSQGNFFQKAGYETANAVNIPIQYLLLRSVQDGSMRNLDGTPTTTDQGVISFGSIPLWFVGGGGVPKATNSVAITTKEGFLFGSVGFKMPFDLRVGLYASENTLKFGTFKWSTIAPEFLTNSNFFGRNMLQISTEFQPQLGTWSSQVIEKGTYVRFGLIGPQQGCGVGTWFQFYAPNGVKFIKP